MDTIDYANATADEVEKLILDGSMKHEKLVNTNIFSINTRGFYIFQFMVNENHEAVKQLILMKASVDILTQTG